MLKDYFFHFFHPVKSFEQLIAKDNMLNLSFVYIFIPIFLYTLMYIFLTIAHGAPSVFKPWLNIEPENYYAVNRFLLAPSMLLCWLLSTSLIQLLSKSFNGAGTFEQTLAVISLSISISMWGGLVHDLPMSFLSAVGIIDAHQHEIDMNSPTIFRTLLWICYSIYFLSFMILFPLATKVVHKLKWSYSIAIGILGFIVFQTMFLVFNR